MWKKTSLLIIGIMLIGIIAETHATIPTMTIAAGTVLKTKYGQLTAVTTKTYDKFSLFAGNGSIVFNVSALELTNIIYTFNVQTFGNGTLNILFQGISPIKVISSGNLFYSNGAQWIQYSSQIETLIVIYGPITEQQKVLFIDDFLYTNPQLESSWTIDNYQNPSASPGQFTVSGFLMMPAKQTSSIESVHVTNPIYDPSIYSTANAIKRKMTVSLVPFAKSESNTASILTGFAPLFTTGTYPGNQPNGVPNSDNAATCAASAHTNDNIGSEQIVMDNSGTVYVVVCGDPSGTRTTQTLLTRADPTLYTVFTVEIYGIFCSTCPDNAYSGSTWAFFRIYQRNSAGNIVTDAHANITAGVAPLFQKSYAFITQTNNNGASSGQVSKIDLVQIQNYGSPVCLVVPSGTLCTNFPIVPNNFGQGVISDIAWLSNQIGFGDPQIGAIIIFFILSGAFCFIPLIFTRNYLIAGEGELVVIGFFTFAGFLPEWVIIIPILGGAVLMVMLIRQMVSGYSFGAGGE